MSSKKKGNGCTTIRCIEDAVKKCGCTMEEFFSVAYGRLGVREELRMFEEFKKHETARYPHYQLPSSVIALAEEVHASKCPRNLFMKRRPSPSDHSFAPAPALAA